MDRCNYYDEMDKPKKEDNLGNWYLESARNSGQSELRLRRKHHGIFEYERALNTNFPYPH
jgi:hypothetical protein